MDKKVLIIEDDRAQALALSEALAENGISVTHESDGKNGLEAAFREHPDLVLLDIELPGMGGLTVLDEMRKDAWGKTASVVIITMHAEPEYVARAMEDSAFDFIAKSDQSLDDIVAKVKIKLGV